MNLYMRNTTVLASITQNHFRTIFTSQVFLQENYKYGEGKNQQKITIDENTNPIISQYIKKMNKKNMTKKSNKFHHPGKRPEPQVYMGMDTQQRRNVKRAIKHGANIYTDIQHQYANTSNWKTPEELAAYMKDNEVFNGEGMVILNKPYGVPKQERSEDSTSQNSQSIANYLCSGGASEKTPCFTDTLKVLKELYQSNLELVSCPERWNSGVTILARSQNQANRLRKGMTFQKTNKITYKSYLTVNLGLPLWTGEEQRLGIDNMGKFKPVVDFSINQVKRREVKPNVISFDVLKHSSDYDASLIQLNVIYTSHNFLRLYLAHNLSPILGDNLYGGKVRSLMGRKYFIKDEAAGDFRLPDLKPEVLKALIINQGMIGAIPNHVHLYEVRVRKDKEDEYRFTAPPPKHFMWSCHRLNLVDVNLTFAENIEMLRMNKKKEKQPAEEAKAENI